MALAKSHARLFRHLQSRMPVYSGTCKVACPSIPALAKSHTLLRQKACAPLVEFTLTHRSRQKRQPRLGVGLQPNVACEFKRAGFLEGGRTVKRTLQMLEPAARCKSKSLSTITKRHSNHPTILHLLNLLRRISKPRQHLRIVLTKLGPQPTGLPRRVA